MAEYAFLRDNLASLPVLGPFVLGLIMLALPRPSLLRRSIVGGALAVLLGFCLWLVLQTTAEGSLVLRIGGWPVPYSIVLVADPLATIMLSLAAFTALSCTLYGFASQSTAEEHPLRLPLLLFLLSGISLSFLAGDLFNLFVAFEVMLLSSYALLTLEAGARESRRAWSYLVVNLLGSALFLATCGFAYGLFGTLNFAEIIVRAEALQGDLRLTMLAICLLLVFGLKAGIFPLYHWLPGSYPMLPAPLAAFFAGMLTKVGVYVLMRMFGTVLPHSLTSVHTLIAWAAGLTMLVGVLGAVGQARVQTILSYHIVSQIGFMVLAIGLHTQAAFTAAIFYIVHHIIVKASLFLVGGQVERSFGSDELARTGGLWLAAPVLSFTFVCQSMSLAGLPPLSGFWGKLMIIQEGFSLGAWLLVALSLVASILTLLSMLKIWLACFWTRQEEHAPKPRLDASSTRMTAVLLAMTCVSLIIGLMPGPLFRLADEAARRTLDRRAYCERVFGANSRLFEGKEPATQLQSGGKPAAEVDTPASTGGTSP